MGKEIERKYLVKGEAWKELGEGVLYRQGYLNSLKERVVRARTMGPKAALTIKGITVGATRLEFEYDIPMDDCNQLLDLCEQPIIEKIRYVIDWEGVTWEVDEFFGVNAGLVVAEVELEDVNQQISFPPWIGDEVTDDPRYFNSNLVARPYSTW